MTWIAITFIVLSLLLIGVIVYRKIPQLRIIDVTSIPQERARRVKEQLILKKLNRTGGAKLRVVEKVASQGVRTASKYGRRAVQRLYKMEQYYQKLKRTASEGQHAYSADVATTLIAEAEGFERQTNKDFRNFLYIAKGSCAEVRSMIILGVGLKYIDRKIGIILYNKTIEISKTLSGFIKTLK